MDIEADAALVARGLSNLSLLHAQSSDANETTSPAGKFNAIQSAAKPALAGIDDVLNTLREVIGWPVLYAAEADALGIKWPRGVLLHGPSGTGKSAAVAVIAAEFNAIVHLVTAGSIVGAFMGESERKLREVFAAADKDAAQSGRPVILFLDDIDSLCPRRGPGQHHEARLVGQLLTLLDGAASAPHASPPPPLQIKSELRPAPIHHEKNAVSPQYSIKKGHVVVIASTSRPNAIDPALRRPGRLDREVAVPVPSRAARLEILKALAAKLPIDPERTNLDIIAAQCHGYTGADLEALCREAAMGAVASQVLADLDLLDHKNGKKESDREYMSLTIEYQQDNKHVTKTLLTTEDFLGAMRRVGASVARTVVKEFPPADWSDIGGLEDTKKRLKQAIEWPITKAKAFKRLGIRYPRGVLLHGPPGCAKTTLARAAATSSGATFIPLQGASLYSMYVGEGEAELRESFRKARLAAPAIIFLDELDMLVGKRGEGPGAAGTDDTSARLLSTFLNEMDGLEQASGVLVLATSNRPDAIDTALLRPGRFDVALYVPPPDHAGRLAALKVHSRKIPLARDVDLDAIAGSTERYTGAELAAVCREAAMAALREDVQGASEVAARHFTAAVKGVRASLTEVELEKYAAWPPRKGTSSM